jgi:hypothetical protein
VNSVISALQCKTGFLRCRSLNFRFLSESRGMLTQLIVRLFLELFKEREEAGKLSG